MAEKDEKSAAIFDDTAARGKIETVGDAGSGTSEDLEKVPTLPHAEKKRKFQFNPLRWRKAPPVPEERKVSGEYKAGFISQLTFHWIGELMDTGYLRPLEFEDIPLVNPNRSATLLADKVTASFDKKRAKGEKHPLLWALHEVFFWEFWSGGAFRLLADILLTMSPFLMKYLISFASKAYYASNLGTKSPPIAQGIGIVLGITALQVVSSLAFNQFVYRGMSTGGVVRASLISLLFSKSMRISARAKAGGEKEDKKGGKDDGKEEDSKKEKKKEQKKKKKAGKVDPYADITGYPNGKVVNLMGTDTYRIDQAMAWFHMVWTSPVIVIIALVMLCINLGPSALAGFALLFAGAPALTLVVRSLAARRALMNKITDKRVSLMQEILLGVKFVKYYAWEQSFLKQLGTIRSEEVHAVQVMLGIRAAVNAVGISLPIFASMLAFVVYSTTGNVVDPAPVFSSLALFNMLRLPLNLMPIVVAQTIDAFVSLKRIEDYLTAEEVDDFVSYDIPKGSDDAIIIEDGEFTWENLSAENKEEDKKDKKDKKTRKSTNSKVEEPEKLVEASKEPFRIRDINLQFGKKELVAVVGPVGSGKTSLLAAIAQDMRKVKGNIRFQEGDQVAYCPQYAWIQNATVRDNIVFGKPFDKHWYDEVTDACALGPDFEILPYGDFTEIGERGITISGGQKARTNIARAIYFNAEIVLMDDPLSAVDAHVGRHLFENAIAGLLKDKCVILATHQLHVLNRVDRVIWMDNGKIRDVGTYDELMARSPDFVKMMEATTVGADEEGEEDEVEKEALELVKKESVALSSKSNTNRAKSKALMQEEERAVKSVPWSMYIAYIKASGTIWAGPAVFLILCLAQASNIMTTLWLGYWTSGKYGFSTGLYIGGYAALGAAQSFFFFAFAYCLMVMGTRASKKLMSNAMERVLRAPMAFFDTTPMGRIVNRFSKDVDVLDNNITDAMRMYFMTLSMISSVIILIIVYYPYFAVALVPLVFFFFFAAAYYRASAREVKRHEAVLRSTVFAKFGEGLSGTACIRAFGLQGRFVAELQDAIDQMDSAYFVTFVNQRWLSLRLDLIGNSMVFVCGILVVTSRLSINPSISGVVLSYVLQIVGMIQWMIRQLAEVENAMNAAERLNHYGVNLESEAPLTSANPPRPSWPEHGEITLENVSMRYRPGLPLVLKGLSMHIEAGQRVAIVGRTGAGKSTIMSVLFRLVEVAGGKVTIDGVDISKIGLHELRRNLAIIPQDPTLFKGTIRSNLDPFNEYQDDVLNEALARCNLLTSAPASPASSTDNVTTLNLQSSVEEGGTNFSLGQRQLLALARALVRNCRIILADEATSSVDLETDAKIQETMRSAFKGKTILTIAHRLGTIVGYDKVVVLGNGGILEYGTPRDLWEEKGVFWEMCERGGVSEDDF